MVYATGWKGGRIDRFTGYFYLNDQGWFYPKVRISPSWAITWVYTQGAGYVMFPRFNAFYYCGGGNRSPKCHVNDSDALRRNMLRAGVAQPPAGFEAHHIDPVIWCGSNDAQNGVFLPQLYTNDEEGYQAKSHTVFSRWWDPKNFTPDNPRPNCQ